MFWPTGYIRAKQMTELRKIEPMGRRDPLLVLAGEISELRREQRLLKEATKTG
jgi:hypothetical protein